MVRSRIAPTPSGYLHVGNAFNFLLTWLLTRSRRGLLRLRIDDLDAPRARQEYIDDIFATLRWLGIDWDEGPQDAVEHTAGYSQQLRLSRYDELLHALATRAQVFACTCSRREVRAQDDEGQYPGTCLHRHLPLDTIDAAWRVITPPGTVITWEDRVAGRQSIDLYRHIRHFIVRRRDGIPAYHIASLADDLDHGINLIVRGADLAESTAAQLYLATLLEEDRFRQAQFCHHALVLDDSGAKLSKSAGSISLRAWRAAGRPVADFYVWFGQRMGWGAHFDTLSALLDKTREMFS